MPRLPTSGKVWGAFDPGVNGALALVSGKWDCGAYTYKMPTTDADLWKLVSDHCIAADAVAVEQLAPRPANVRDYKTGEWRSTILKSTCVLWGNYRAVRAMLAANRSRIEEVLPKRWQADLRIPPRAKGETDVQWKNRLKAKAQQLFPKVDVFLWNADALLIAEWLRRREEGRL